jgi:exodeoxyribonuclease VII small subunit
MAKASDSEKVVTLEGLLKGEVGMKEVSELKFERALGLLEEVVASVESGGLPLDQAIGSYEQGTLLIQHLRTLLSGAEEKLRTLSPAGAS